MRKIWDKFVAWLYKVPFDKWLHFIFGVLIAAFFACSLGMRACIVPVVFAGFCKEFFDLWVKRHHQMIDTVIQDDRKRIDLFNKVDQLFDQLRSIYYGVYLIHDLSAKTQDAIISYGERLSSNIVAALVKGGIRMNSRDFIRTEYKQGKHVLDTELTNQLVKEAFSPITNNKTVAVVPGFIARDRDSHETTNLGRGGSDYTAAIIAAALDAEVLEIWTDVDGFMTADPKVIKSAYTINELSYVEAMELCNFGAKVIYPPTIYPVSFSNSSAVNLPIVPNLKSLVRP